MGHICHTVFTAFVFPITRSTYVCRSRFPHFEEHVDSQCHFQESTSSLGSKSFPTVINQNRKSERSTDPRHRGRFFVGYFLGAVFLFESFEPRTRMCCTVVHVKIENTGTCLLTTTQHTFQRIPSSSVDFSRWLCLVRLPPIAFCSLKVCSTRFCSAVGQGNRKNVFFWCVHAPQTILTQPSRTLNTSLSS